MPVVDTVFAQYTRQLACLAFVLPIFACLSLPTSAQHLERPYGVSILTDENARESYSYRKVAHAKTLALMLYGFKDGNAVAATPAIPKDRKALSAFFRQHMDRVKKDYLTPESANSMRFVTGQAAFNSAQLNSGPGLDPAKMVGVTLPYGKLTLGGGFTWGEKNPALMMRQKADGFFAGAGYDTGKAGFQLSYLASGERLGGMRMGGGKYRTESLMFGTSFRVNRRMGLTATLQYRRDADPLTTGDEQGIVTVGTRWKF